MFSLIAFAALIALGGLAAAIGKELRMYSRSVLRSVMLMISFLVGVLVGVISALSGKTEGLLTRVTVY